MPHYHRECKNHHDWPAKEIRLHDVADKIPNGSSVYIGSAAATAEAALQSLVADDSGLEDIQIIHMIPGGADLPHLSQNVDRFRTVSFYSFHSKCGGYFKPEQHGKQQQQEEVEGLEDYKPVSVATVPRLLDEQKLHVDVAIIKVSPPVDGYVSLGIDVESTVDFIRHADTVIAEVNEHMPWTEGLSAVPVSDIDWWIAHHEPLKTTAELWPQFFESHTTCPRQCYWPEHVMNKIGQNVVNEIPDGATLRFGVNPIVHSVFPFLDQRNDLGLHTDILTEELYRLHERGVITNERKTLDRGKSVVSLAYGSRDMYSWLDRNPAVEFHPSSYVSDPKVLSQIDNLISVVGALKVDLTGQVATDSIAHKIYGGVWNDSDAVRGAKLSAGGKPVVVLASKSLHGRSNVVIGLPEGTGVSITRSDVEYVVTEYGTAYLHGKSIRERCLSLIEIAHPDFRQELLERAKEHHYVSQSQPGKSFVQGAYPAQYECYYTTKKNKRVFVRPVKAVDEDDLRTFFHKLSDHSVYLRYFRAMASIPQRVLQRTADVDYSSDMAIVALSPPDNDANQHRHEIVGIAQWISNGARAGAAAVPEIAFQVRDDYQGEGLGTFLFRKLIDIAKANGVAKLQADVLLQNRGMIGIMKKSKVPCKAELDFGVITYRFTLENEKRRRAGVVVVGKESDDNKIVPSSSIPAVVAASVVSRGAAAVSKLHEVKKSSPAYSTSLPFTRELCTGPRR